MAYTLDNLHLNPNLKSYDQSNIYLSPYYEKAFDIERRMLMIESSPIWIELNKVFMPNYEISFYGRNDRSFNSRFYLVSRIENRPGIVNNFSYLDILEFDYNRFESKMYSQLNELIGHYSDYDLKEMYEAYEIFKTYNRKRKIELILDNRL